MSPSTTINQAPVKPTPLAAPSLDQIGVDLEALALARNQARYQQLLAASKITVEPRRRTAFESRLVNPRTINPRPSVYLTVSSNNQPSVD